MARQDRRMLDIGGPATASDLSRFRMTPLAWTAAALLLAAALFFVIRLLEFDLINEKTPNQDDPLPPSTDPR